MAQSPCFLLPLADSLFTSLSFVFTYLETLLDVIGSRPPWSHVARKLISPFPSPPHSKIPTPWGFPGLNMRLTKTTLQLLLQGPEHYVHLFFYILFSAWGHPTFSHSVYSHSTFSHSTFSHSVYSHSTFSLPTLDHSTFRHSMFSRSMFRHSPFSKWIKSLSQWYLGTWYWRRKPQFRQSWAKLL